jgi:hypothetical protein
MNDHGIDQRRNGILQGHDIHRQPFFLNGLSRDRTNDRDGRMSG